MRKPLHLTICLFVAPAVLVSGCGSTKTASTNTAVSTSAGTSAPATQSTQAVPPSTSSKATPHPGNAGGTTAGQAKAEPKQKAAEAVPEQKETAAEREAFARHLRKVAADRRRAAIPGLEAAEARLPKKRRYPKELQGKFLGLCKAAKGSTKSCECIIVKQELNTKVEVGQSLAELLALEIAFQREGASLEDVRQRRVPAPRIVRRVTRECR
jgi:hypothetical protein